MRKVLSIAVTALALAGCASTSTTQLAANVVRIDASAAPACGRTGVIKLVNKMAAVETIRLGYDKYIITAQDSANNVRVVGANYNTYGSAYASGGYANYNGYTTATPIYGGTQDAAVTVVMFKNGSPEAQHAIDARTALGAEWQEIVAEGAPNSCMD